MLWLRKLGALIIEKYETSDESLFVECLWFFVFFFYVFFSCVCDEMVIGRGGYCTSGIDTILVR